MMIKADLHNHSIASNDGRSPLSDICRAAKAKGLDAVAICDHNLCTPVQDAEGVLLIPGVEISTDCGHILGLFLESPICFENIEKEDYFRAEDAIREIHRCGGTAVLAHPFAPQKVSEEVLKSLPVDAIETANARAALKSGSNERAAALAAERGLPQTGGSDGHCAKEIGGAYTELDCGRTIAEIKAALLAGKGQTTVKTPCRWIYKGFSQVTRDYRLKGLPGAVRACGYLAGCVARDLFKF